MEEVVNCRYLGQLGDYLGQLKQVSTWGLPGTIALPVVDVLHLAAPRPPEDLNANICAKMLKVVGGQIRGTKEARTHRTAGRLAT